MIPNKSAHEALLEVTDGERLFSSVDGSEALSDRYLAGLQQYPVPAEGTSYEECRDWALEVCVAADHHVGEKTVPEVWQVQTAKARFSEVFRRARSEGPQRITKLGKEGVVMLAEEQYEKLLAKSRRPKSLVEFLRASPLVGVELDLTRDPNPARDIDL